MLHFTNFSGKSFFVTNDKLELQVTQFYFFSVCQLRRQCLFMGLFLISSLYHKVDRIAPLQPHVFTFEMVPALLVSYVTLTNGSVCLSVCL